MVLAVLGVHPGNVVVVAGQAANGARPREQSHAGLSFSVVTQVHHSQLRDRLQETHAHTSECDVAGNLGEKAP